MRSAIDLLAQSTIVFAERRYTFQQFYAVFINGTYARPYLRQLAETDTLERDGPQLQAETARKILAWLRLNGLTPSIISGAEYLTMPVIYPLPASALATSSRRCTSWMIWPIHDRISTSRVCTMPKVAPSGRWSS